MGLVNMRPPPRFVLRRLRCTIHHYHDATDHVLVAHLCISKRIPASLTHSVAWAKSVWITVQVRTLLGPWDIRRPSCLAERLLLNFRDRQMPKLEQRRMTALENLSEILGSSRQSVFAVKESFAPPSDQPLPSQPVALDSCCFKPLNYR